MTLSQELLTLESIARLALSDLRAAQTTHDLSREFHSALKDTLADYARAISEQKHKAVAHER